MSTRQAGNRRENRVGAMLRAHGYEPFYSRGSRGVDILAVSTEEGRPHLRIAVSRPSYTAVRGPFEKLRAAPKIPGAIDLLIREVERNEWRIYADEDTFFDDDLDAAITWGNGAEWRSYFKDCLVTEISQ
jgi:hypothetical protein